MSNLEDKNRFPQIVSGKAGTPALRTAYDLPEERWDGGNAPASESLLLEYARLLRRRRKTILLLALAGALIGFTATFWRLPVYRARTSLDIQNLNDNFLNRSAVALTSDGADSTEESRVQTQIKLLQSDTLRKRTVERMKAAGSAGPVPRGDLFSQWSRALHLPAAGDVSGEELLRYAARHVTIKPLGVTRLVEVTCDSYDPKFSADFCNTLTSEFSARDRDTRMIDAQKTSEYLSRQLLDVREGVSTAERKLEAATGKDGLMLPQNGGTVAEQRLQDLQTEYMRAQADRIQKQSQYDNSLSATPESLPIVLDSAGYRDQQTRLAELRHQVAMLVPPLTEANPRVQHLRAQIAEAEGAETVVKHNVVSRLANEYEAARHRESMLRAAYDEQERKVSAEMTHMNQMSMMRHELESGQQLYQTLLQRVKEAGFAAAMQASTVRVVDAAMLLPIPISPRYPSAIATGLLVGLILGVVTAFLTERTQTLLRAPGDGPRYLHLRELGVIPSVRPSLRMFPLRDSHKPAAATGFLTLSAAAEAHRTPARGGEMSLLQNRTSLMAEAYRNATYSVLRTSKAGTQAKVYVVTSPSVGDGKTTVTCNLGVALAQANKRVLLVDGDLRRPRLHEVAGIENKFGLRDVLRIAAGALPPATEFCVPTTVANLFVLPTGKGREEPSTLLHSTAMADLVRRLSADFDLILIDSPPAIHIADARILAGLSDGVILVFRARSTAREAAMTARDLFLGDEVEVVGTILNDFDPTREGQSRYYSSYYAYAGNDEDAGGTAEKVGGVAGSL